ncbi:MAG: threonine/serine exporter family protein [Myxococcota bacterium]|nr:threonine/serine exporter family protein [Myxococcota bacterium]
MLATRAQRAAPFAAPMPAYEAADRAEAFIIDLGSALLRQGIPAHRVEDTLGLVSQLLGLEGQFFCVPTGIIASFGVPGSQRGGIVRVQPGGINLARMVRLDALVTAVVRGLLPPDRAAEGLRSILAAPSAYGPLALVLAEAVAAGTAAPFFGGGLREGMAAAFIGAVMATLGMALDRRRASHLFAPIGATLAAAMAALAPLVTGPLRVDVVTVSGLLVLLPGLTLTTAVAEVATRNLVSGTARLTVALLTLLELGFGVALGSQAGALIPTAALEPLTPALGVECAALLASAAAFVILFQTRLQDAHLVVAGVVVAYGGARVGAAMMGPELGAFLGALLVGLASSIVSRVCDRPAQVALVPGVLMLVPGSVGFSSVRGMLRAETLQAVDAAFHTGIIAISIVVGLLAAPALLPPRRAL